jgi:hypothetical protein
MFNADYTLTNFNGASDEARNAVLVIGGTNSEIRNIVTPSVNKTYIVNNNTSGGFAVNIKTSGGTGIQIPNGSIYLVYCDGTEFYAISKAFSSSNVANTLVLRDGSGNFAAGTITANVTGNLTGNASNALSLGGNLANTYAPLASPTFTGTPAAPTASGGTNTTQVATTAYVQTTGYNSQGAKTLSTSTPTGGANGDIWYQY